jgi:hypothetical protein
MTEREYVERIQKAAAAYIAGLGKTDIPQADYENWQRIRAGLSVHTMLELCNAYLVRDQNRCASQEHPASWLGHSLSWP